AENESDIEKASRFVTESSGIKENFHLRIFSNSGKIVYDSFERIPVKDKKEKMVEAEALPAINGAEKNWFSMSGSQRYLHTTVPIRRYNKIIGGIDAEASLRQIDDGFKVMRKYFFIAFFFSLIVALVIAVFFTQSLIKPVFGIRDAAVKIAAGEFSTRVKPYGSDEIGQLSNTINYMAEQLERHIRIITEEKSKMNALLSAMVDGVIAVDLDGKVTFINTVAAGIIKKYLQSALEIPFIDMVSNEEVLSLYRQSLEQKTILSKEINISGAIYIIFVVPFSGQEKKQQGSMIIFRDVTELRKLEIARSQFLSSVSHELRTPLTIIKGFVMTLIDTPEIDEETKRSLELINQETDRLTRLVDDLLELSRLRSKKFSLQLYWNDPAEILQETVQQLLPQAKRYQIELTLDCPASMQNILMDPDRIKQVLINLIDNAFKFTPAGGKVEVKSTSDTGLLKIEVSDTGIGIPENEIPMLFERFFRSKSQYTRRVQGSGLGLAIVKEIVEAHHGTVSVASKMGQGASFIISIPMQYKEG
ncbi:MAG: cell wall metabolism sensor histidine kinase WalK, partial [Firmicutes bacterium]|nr:cell wall metabolism sensor histidine kinase WalK [Bacillota bacterium]